MHTSHCPRSRATVPRNAWSGPNTVVSTRVKTDRAVDRTKVLSDRASSENAVRDSSLRGQAEEQAGQGEGHDAHGEPHGAVEGALRPGDDPEGGDAHDESDHDEPGHLRARQDRLFGVAGAAVHQARGRLPVAEADRLEQHRREVDPQGLQGEERDATGDVEDRRAEERDDEAEQAAHLEPDVLDEVVVQPAPQLDRLDDGREVVVGQHHHGGVLGDLGAGDAHRDTDVGALQCGRVVHAVAGHRDDPALPLEQLDQTDLVLRRDAGDDARRRRSASAPRRRPSRRTPRRS